MFNFCHGLNVRVLLDDHCGDLIANLLDLTVEEPDDNARHSVGQFGQINPLIAVSRRL